MRAKRNRFVPIFMLHRMQDKVNRISGHSPAALAEMLAFVEKQKYNVISLEQLVNVLLHGDTLPPKSLVFTMDDGFYDQLSVAVPLFEKFGFPVSIFLLGRFSSGESWPWDYRLEYIFQSSNAGSFHLKTQCVEKKVTLTDFVSRKKETRYFREILKQHTTDQAEECIFSMADQLSVPLQNTPPDAYRQISWDDARAAESDLVQFGPHSLNHAILAKQDSATCRHEIEQSRALVFEHLANPLNVFCYPTGRKGQDFSDREMAMAQEAGFDAAVSVTPGFVDSVKHGADAYRYCLPRFALPHDSQEFIRLCSWVELLKEQLRGNL